MDNLYLTAKRIMWSKCSNAGQTCIAPDYVLCQSSALREKFLKTCSEVIQEFYTENVKACPDFARIVNEMHTKRLSDHISASRKDKQCSVVFGGDTDIKARYIQPTLISIGQGNSSRSDFVDIGQLPTCMQEEIFGPLLPVYALDIENSNEFVQEVGAIVNAVGEKPLALYIYSKNTSTINGLIEKIPSGGVMVNDCSMHYANPNIPFGGIGNSGMGTAHGEYGFKAFTHTRSIMRRHDSIFTDIPQRYPPYSSVSLLIFRINSMLPSMPYVSKEVTSAVMYSGLAYGLYSIANVVAPSMVNQVDVAIGMSDNLNALVEGGKQIVVNTFDFVSSYLPFTISITF